MHAAQRALLRTERVVDLAEMIDEIMLAKFMLAERAREKAAIVALFFKIDQIRAARGVSVKIMEDRCVTLRAG